MFKAFASRCVIALAAVLFFGVSCGPGEIVGVETEGERSGASNHGTASSPNGDASKPGDDVSSGVDASAGTDATAPTPLATSADGLAVLEELRTRFTVLSAPIETDPSDEESGDLLDAAARAPTTTTPLAAGIADGFDIEDSAVRPHFPVSLGKPSARTALGRKATTPFRVEEAATGTAIEVSLHDTRDVSAQAAAGYLVYRQAHASGATVLHRALTEGTEEFLSFEGRPSTQEVTYDVTFLKGVSGLRTAQPRRSPHDDVVQARPLAGKLGIILPGGPGWVS